MTDAQWRVLYILLAAFAIELVASPPSQNIVAGVLGQPGKISGSLPIGQQLQTSTLAGLAFVIGVLLLLLLASAAPQVATWLAIIILLSVTIRQQSVLVGLIGGATTGLNAIRTGQAGKTNG